MSIPTGQEYMMPELGLGKIASYQRSQVDSAAVKKDINFGQAVQVIDDEASPLTTGDFYGVAVAKNYVDEYTDDKAGVYKPSEAVSVLRQGTITVIVDEDVKSGEKAVVNTATSNFLPSTTAKTTKTEVIGVFKSTTSRDGLAKLEINLP
ncbi:structural cement protein Gp24 [Listeria monocytogenes]